MIKKRLKDERKSESIFIIFLIFNCFSFSLRRNFMIYIIMLYFKRVLDKTFLFECPYELSKASAPSNLLQGPASNKAGRTIPSTPTKFHCPLHTRSMSGQRYEYKMR